MSASETPHFAVLRMEGTNCEYETFSSLKNSGASPSYVHIKSIENGHVDLSHFSGIVIPGGFSAGDYIRAGIIFASRLSRSSLRKLEQFKEDGKIIVGICNGFQVLVEMGLLPGLRNNRKVLALHINESFRFESRNVFVKISSDNRIFRDRISKDMVWEVPVAHAEGRLLADSYSRLGKLEKDGQLLFRYCDPNGGKPVYPLNPNGSALDAASITSKGGNIIGIMPHPERIYHQYLLEKTGGETFGKVFFDSIVEYSKEFA